MDWYYAQGDQRFGPLEEVEIRRLASIGRLQRTHFVWHAGFASWRPAGEVEALFPSAAVSSPPPHAPVQPVPPPFPFPAPVATTVTYAGFGARFAAFLIDFVIILALSFALGLLLGLLSTIQGNTDTRSLEIAANLLGLILNWLYFAGLESSPQMATFGKRALKLVVTDLEGRQISFARATGRYFGKIISGLVLCIGYLSIVYHPRKQGWHDQMARCLVLRNR